MSTRLPDMSKAAITARLRQAGALSDLAPARRLDGKLDLSAAAVTSRLREAAALLELCRTLEGARKEVLSS